MNRIVYVTLIILLGGAVTSCQKDKDQEVIEAIFSEALADSTAYHNLQYLSDSIGGRLACSPEGTEAVKWTKQIMEQMSLDTVFLQEMQVKNWDRGKKEQAFIHLKSADKTPIKVCALGRGKGTDGIPLRGQIIEVHSLEELEALPTHKTQGKIIFFNGAMDPSQENTFRAYGEQAGQRFYGPIKAAEKKAKGAIIRSLTTSIDTFPHTGVTKYALSHKTVPSVSIATKHANLIHKKLQNNPKLEVSYTTWCQNKPDTTSYNVVGEIRGSVYPEKIITIGGHLDAWDNSDGAHDDGAGCMQAIEVLRIFRQLGIQPKHTIRAVMFMDEEISQMGGKTYARQAKINGEQHILALESDRGATTPLGFSISAQEEILEAFNTYKPLFKPYNIQEFKKGGGGVDINPLKQFNTVLVGYVPDPTHYFNWHHSGNDTFDQIDFKEFQSGSAAIASFIYLADKYNVGRRINH